jgi:hypothetical protein
VIRNAKPQMVKNEDLQKMIQFTRSTYAWRLKMPWIFFNKILFHPRCVMV